MLPRIHIRQLELYAFVSCLTSTGNCPSDVAKASGGEGIWSCSRLQWCGRHRMQWMLQKGLSLLSLHPDLICILSFVFLNYKEAAFWGSTSFTLLVLYTASRVRILQQHASQNCGLRYHRPWFWKNKYSP